ncbi:centrosomal protein kizuna isoform X3 [Leucoraja erinacea]|uniref:centrosomal protein kizuna isoform X3 n=1 Tax=Leucoraja erinaceus TaxID=7782 RepID=UPI002457B442|nr:centrosomal protein kizuna isoform X3 [Leucoraja erinacea]
MKVAAHRRVKAATTSGSAAQHSAVALGNGSQAAANMAASELDTLEKVAELQRQLHASECKRLELEKNLLACSKSDQWMRSSARLKSYLNEVRERERTAQLRNQQLLNDFESFQAQVTALTASSDTWKQMKMEYEKQVERLLPVWKEKLKTQGMDKEKNIQQERNSSNQTSTNVGKYLSKGLYHTATHFMGQPTSETANGTCLSPQQNYYLPMESILSPQPNRQVAAMQCNSVMDNLKVLTSSKGRQNFHTVSDTMDRKTGLPDCEVMPLTPIISSKTARHNNEAIEINRNIRAKGSVGSLELASPAAQLGPIKEEMKEGTMQKDVKNQLPDKDNIRNNPATPKQTPEQFQKLPMDPAHDSGSFAMTRQRSKVFYLESKNCQNQNKDAAEALKSREDVQRLADELYNSESGASTSGSSEELHMEECLEDPYASVQYPKTTVNGNLVKSNKSPFTKDERTSSSKKEHGVHSITLPPVIDGGKSVNSTLCGEPHGPPEQSQKDEECLSFEGFCHLLHSIEDAVGGRKATYSELYHISAISIEKLKEITRICNRKGSLNKESLEACGAVVLHQLRELSRGSSNGALFPDELLNKCCEAVDEINYSLSKLPAESARLWDHWYSHILSLLEHQLLNIDEAAEIFGPLLVAENSNSKKATELLKKILSKAIENQSVQSNDSSCNLSSIFNDSAEINTVDPMPWLHVNKTKQQAETRAYELLKQSAMQPNKKNDSDLHSPVKRNKKYTKKVKSNNDDNHETDSSEESAPFRCKNKRVGSNPAKSKGFYDCNDQVTSKNELEEGS